MIGKINVGGGGLEINGIIESYTASAGGSISAGDFVSYVNDLAIGTDTQMSTTIVDTIEAVALSRSTVLVTYRYYSSDHYIYGQVCTISGTTITTGTETAICTRDGAYGDLVVLDSNKVMITYYTASSPAQLYARVCTINDTTITLGDEQRITTALTLETGYNPIQLVVLSSTAVLLKYGGGQSGSTSYTYYAVCRVCTISGTTITTGNEQSINNVNAYYSNVVALSSTKFFVTYRQYLSPYYTYGQVCTISGTTITTGTETQISTMATGENYPVVLDGSTVLVAYDKNNSIPYYTYGRVCTISGTTITKGTETQISATTSDPMQKFYVLDNFTVFVTFANAAGNNDYIYGCVCQRTGTTFTTGSTTQISNVSASTNYPVVLDGSTVLVTYPHYSASDGGSSLYGRVCTISGTTITKGTEKRLSTTAAFYDAPVVSLSRGAFVYVSRQSGSPYRLYGVAWQLKAKTTSSGRDAILGVANTSAAAGASADVYVPNV